MAVRNCRPDEIPAGAVVLETSEGIIDHQWKLLREWPNRWEVWPFRFGFPALAGITSLSGLVINMHYRRKLKLFRHGMLATSFAMIMTPALITVGCHAILITHDIFLNTTECLLCLQRKAVMVQIGFGFFYPLTLAPIANFMYAVRHGTYRLPYWADYKETTKLVWKMIKPGKEKLLALMVAQAFFVAYLTYAEKTYLMDFQLKLLELENEISQEKKKTAIESAK